MIFLGRLLFSSQHVGRRRGHRRNFKRRSTRHFLAWISATKLEVSRENALGVATFDRD